MTEETKNSLYEVISQFMMKPSAQQDSKTVCALYKREC